MFGYITINRPELKVKDLETYQGFYCGLCRSLKNQYGFSGRMTLTYDMTFLVILLTGLYEPETAAGRHRCLPHPAQRHICLDSGEFTSYAADMNILFSYYKLLDDWTDEHKPGRRAAARVLAKGFRRACGRYPEKAGLIRERLEQLKQCEKERETDLDKAAGLFGSITEELFLCRRDQWEAALRRMGFFLGKFIYLMDAYEDMESDQKSGCYNPLLLSEPDGMPEEACVNILTMMMAECCRAFETLPVLTHADILRNILYSGVWSRYETVKQKRKDNSTS